MGDILRMCPMYTLQFNMSYWLFHGNIFNLAFGAEGRGDLCFKDYIGSLKLTDIRFRNVYDVKWWGGRALGREYGIILDTQPT